MDHFRTKLLLLKAVYIATAVVLIMGQCQPKDDSINEECCPRSECLEQCSTLDCNSERECTAITGTPQIVELSFNEIPPNSVPCGTNHREWCKAGRCANCTTKFSKNKFSGDFSLSDQGNYFAKTRNSDLVCNDTRLFVAIDGAETYLGTFNFSHPGQTFGYRVRCIRQCVNKIYCQGSGQHQCHYAVRQVLYISQSLQEVYGLLYLRNFSLNLEVNHTCSFKADECQRYHGSELKTSGIFQKVSFCGSGFTGNFTFPKTNIGMTANSTENCPGSKKPRATRLCKGDFIKPSVWDDPIVKNCNEEADIHSTDNPVTIIKTVTEDSALPTTNVLESSLVTTGSTIEAIMMSTENINDDIPVTKENVNEVSRMLSEATKTPERFDAAHPMWVSERLQDIGSSSPTDNPVTIIKSVTEDSALPTTNVLESTPVTTGSTIEAIMMSTENINDDISVTKENVNEVSRMLSEATKTSESFDAAHLMSVSERLQDISEVSSSSPTDNPVTIIKPVTEDSALPTTNVLESTPVTTDAAHPMWVSKRLQDIGSSSPTDNPVTIIKPVTEDSALPTTNVLESTPVTTGNTIEAIMMSTENINDDIPVTKENVNEVSRILSEATKTPESFDAARLMWVSERLQDISEVGSSSPTVTRNVMEIVDNFLNVREDVYGKSISKGAPSRILRALEAQLTNLQKGEKNFTFVRSSVGAVASQLQRPVFGENITFGGFFPIKIEDIAKNMNGSKVSVMTGNDNHFTKYLATITLPAYLLDEISTGRSDKVPVTFIIHRTSLLFMSTSSQQRRQRESVESLVISATVEGQHISNLSSPVISRFQLPRVEGIMTNNSRKCVFWDLTLADGFGDWSSEGCELVVGSQNDTDVMIECHCNHLTSFAVLLDVQGDIGHIVLDILSIIGCVVSIFALFITLIVLLAVKKLREQVPQKIIINLCFALLGLYICFLVGIGQTSLGTGCIIFGALIHYFCLASVAWMCIVATNMYLLFVRVFNADVTGFMWKACLAAWGLPMVVVVVSVILKSQHYASSYCFPQAESLIFYVGVVLLIALMLCYNLIIFILIVRQVTCGRIGKPVGRDKRTEMFERAQSIIIISILVGLTWVFGFLSIGIARFFFNLLFLIFNSLQGFFVFVFFVLRPKNVRMILFRRCYRSQEKNTGRYTVNTTKTDGNSEQKDTLDIDDIVVTSSQSKINTLK